jgi:hypothetical protein
MTRVGWLVSAACASAGTGACPPGLPPGAGTAGGLDGDGPGGALDAAGTGALAAALDGG